MTDAKNMTATEVAVREILYPLDQKVKQLSKDFIESHDALSTSVTRIDKRLSDSAHVVMPILETLQEQAIDDAESFRIIYKRFAELEAVNGQLEPDRAELYTALVSAQLEIKNAEALVDNEFTKKKYADLAAVMDAVREPLAKNGLAIIQLTADGDNGLLGIKTILAHTSGATIEDVITMHPEKSTPQGVGSCRTYMRRYAVLAMCGIAGAVDDDAEGATADPNDYARITEAEVERIIYLADELFDDKADGVVKHMLGKIFMDANVVGDIAEGQMEVALTYLENAQKLKEKRDKAAEKKAEKAAADEKAAKKAADAEADG